MCGIGGAIGDEGIAYVVRNFLGEVQDRGQDTAGIYTIDNAGLEHQLKNDGLVAEVFNGHLDKLPGPVAVGHTRYKTIGGSGVINAQPFSAETKNSRFVLCISENGHIQNYPQLREQLETKGYWFNSTNDAEVIVKTLAHYLGKEGASEFPKAMFSAVGKTIDSLKGAYTCVTAVYDRMTKTHYLVAFADPRNIRPGVWGLKEGSYAVASESIALEEGKYRQIHDIKPGECIIFNTGAESKLVRPRKRKHCAFEWAYFAQALSTMQGRDINDFRYRSGKALAQEHADLAERVDCVVPVPFTPIPTAIGVADAWDVPLKYAIAKRRSNPKRTFIMPDQETREREAEAAFRVIRSVVRGKRLAIVEDSTVRGTNCKVYGRRLREAGASFIALLSAYPRIINTCDKGIDMSTLDQLIAHNRTDAEIAKKTGFDEKRYISPDNFLYVLSQQDHHHVEPLVKEGLFNQSVLENELTPSDFCTSCFTGEDPTANDTGGLVE